MTAWTSSSLSDEYLAYETAIEDTFGEPVPAPPERTPGRPRIAPERRLPAGLIHATVHKHRETNRVVVVEPRQAFDSPGGLEDALGGSAASCRVNTAFVERQNGTDRGPNVRKARKTYRFSKDWRVQETMTYPTLYDSINSAGASGRCGSGAKTAAGARGRRRSRRA